MQKEHQVHSGHQHVHGPGCGHAAIKHNGHTDYIHDGHLHAVHEDHVDECKLNVSESNPDTCTPQHACGAHEPSHVHGQGCGHEALPHGEHTDYLVYGHLHHPHNGHCDDHGAVNLR